MILEVVVQHMCSAYSIYNYSTSSLHPAEAWSTICKHPLICRNIKLRPIRLFLESWGSESIHTILLYLRVLSHFSWKRICLQCGRPGFDPWVGKVPWRRERLQTPVFDLENSLDCTVHGVARSWMPMIDFHFHFQVNLVVSNSLWPYGL